MDAPAADLLRTLRVASPCSAEWAGMQGDGATRFCSQCSKHVHDLSSMTPTEVHALLTESDEPPCVRFRRRIDGTVLTGDCPVGFRRLRGKVRATYAAIATFVLGLFGSGCSEQPDKKRYFGDFPNSYAKVRPNACADTAAYRVHMDSVLTDFIGMPEWDSRCGYQPSWWSPSPPVGGPPSERHDTTERQVAR